MQLREWEDILSFNYDKKRNVLEIAGLREDLDSFNREASLIIGEYHSLAEKKEKVC